MAWKHFEGRSLVKKVIEDEWKEREEEESHVS